MNMMNTDYLIILHHHNYQRHLRSIVFDNPEQLRILY